MCDHHRLHGQSPAGDIDHVHHLSENIGALFYNEDYRDITIVVEGKQFQAHKVILAARSEYFRALLFGGMRESQPGTTDIELRDTRANAFQMLLRYIYTGKLNVSDMKEDTLLDVLGLSHQYGFVDLEASLSEYLRATLTTRNVCPIYDMANMFGLQLLILTCYEYMDKNAQDVVQNENFLALSKMALLEVIKRDSFCAFEIDLFKAVFEWSKRNPEESTEDIIKAIRLPLMSLNELLNVVRPSGLIPPDSILDAIKTQTECRDMEMKYRGFLIPEENIATLRHGAQVIRGECKTALLDGDVQNYDLDRGFTRHPIDDNYGQGIVIRLGQPSIINTIKMLLWDRDMRSYSYYIEVSMDDKDYVRVVDHQMYLCRSWQRLHFNARVVRFVRVVGTFNSVNKVFHCVAVECLYSGKTFQIERGLLVPTENIATTSMSACVIEGVSRSRNALINGDTKNYDWDSGYTCHQLGSGAIVVQLAQPYVIGSMRLLLWDCDERSYRFTIEVSTDQHNWKMVAERSKQDCKSWQLIRFLKRPVTFIRIIGTHNTANEVFHCVHFECPADIEVIGKSCAEPGEFIESDSISDSIDLSSEDSITNSNSAEQPRGPLSMQLARSLSLA